MKRHRGVDIAPIVSGTANMSRLQTPKNNGSANISAAEHCNLCRVKPLELPLPSHRRREVACMKVAMTMV